MGKIIIKVIDYNGDIIVVILFYISQRPGQCNAGTSTGTSIIKGIDNDHPCMDMSYI
jgi:hypothetical protein